MSEEEQIILPSGFRRLRYIQSSGTQYITTDYYPEAGQKYILMDVNFINISDSWAGNKYIFNASEKGNPSGEYDILYGCGLNFGGYDNQRYEHFFWVGGDRNDNNSVCSVKWEADTVLSRNTFEIKGNTCTYGSQTVDIINGGIRAGTTPLTIFGAADKPIDCYGMRLYEFKMGTFENNQPSISLHLIPCLDDTDKVCMYDVVNGKVYYNKGTGDFLYKLDIEDEQPSILHKLPEGFTKVDYLISNGSQWIDTNYIPTNETGYYIECQTYLANNNSRAVFGLFESDGTSTKNRIYLYLNPYPSVGWNKITKTLTNQTSWQKEELKCGFNFFNNRTVFVNAKDLTLTHFLTDLSFTPTVPIYLFNSYGNTNADGRIKGQINTFIISEGDKIVRQFVPCLDADNVPCMYEIYEGTAYYNQGEGQFSYPQVYINHEYNLPANYKRCAYLQSNGTQYINTGHAANDETGLYLKAQQLSYGDFVPFGASEDTSLYLYAPRINKNLIAYAWTTYITGFTWDKGDDLIFTSTLNLYNDRTVRFDSLDSDFTALLDNTLGQMTQPLGLFSWNAKGSFNTSSGTWGGRIYRAKITQGSALIHDYIPCLDGDNRPCMWDAITGETKYNQSGGEEFEYCLEHQLPSDFVKLEYIESTGTQYIKTGYIPANTTGLYIDAQDIGSGDTIPMGLRESSSTDTRFFITRQTASANTGYGWGAWTGISTTKGSVRYDSTLNWLNDRKSITNTPLFAAVIKNLEELPFTPSLDIWMFGINQGGSHAYKFKGRIYRAKISEGSEIVRDYVPAYDQKRYKPCMYDLINNVAYYNDGEGEFKYNNRLEGNYTGYSGLGCIGNRLGGYYPQT